MSDPAATFDARYIEQRLRRHFDDANTRVLIKWNEDNGATTKANALGGSRHYVLLADSALTIGKEALSGAFLTFLSYSRDCGARTQDHLDVAQTASDAFIARVGSELEERTLRQVNFGLPRETTMPIVEGLRADLHAALDGYVEDAIRGRHGDQRIVAPPPSVGWEPTDEHTVVNIEARRAQERETGFRARVTPLDSVAATGYPREVAATYGVSAEHTAALSITEADDTLSATGFVFPLAWEPDRLELLQQHALLVPLAEKLPTDDGARHNRRTIREIVNDVMVGANALYEEAAAKQPHLAAIRAGERLLRVALAELEEWKPWLAEQRGRFVNAAVDQAGKRTGDAIVVGIVLIALAILDLIAHLFHLL